MSTGIYKTIVELIQALEEGKHRREELIGFNDKYELFINDRSGETLFSAYYGTLNACQDICYLLGIRMEEA